MRLDRPTIVRHAFEVLNEAGLEGLTLRRLAARLHVQAPAIYWHFKSKGELLDEMGTQVLMETVADEPALQELTDWRKWACAYCRNLRKALLRYRDGAKMASGTYLTDTRMYEVMEMSLSRLTAAGFTLRESVVTMTTLYSYTVGFVIEEQARQSGDGTLQSRYAPEERERRVDAELHPLAAAAGTEMFTDSDSRFDEGVGLIVKGAATTLEAIRPAD
jgi:AcrR family transcriptional regulator